MGNILNIFWFESERSIYFKPKKGGKGEKGF